MKASTAAALRQSSIHHCSQIKDQWRFESAPHHFQNIPHTHPSSDTVATSELQAAGAVASVKQNPPKHPHPPLHTVTYGPSTAPHAQPCEGWGSCSTAAAAHVTHASSTYSRSHILAAAVIILLVQAPPKGCHQGCRSESVHRMRPAGLQCQAQWSPISWRVDQQHSRRKPAAAHIAATTTMAASGLQPRPQWPLALGPQSSKLSLFSSS